MGKRFRIGLAIVIVAFIGAVVWQFIRPRPDDPVYQGKHLSAWLNDIDWRIGNTNSEIASDAVHQIGTNALPMLLTMIQAKDSWGPQFSSFAWFVHRKLPFFPVLMDPKLEPPR